MAAVNLNLKFEKVFKVQKHYEGGKFGWPKEEHFQEQYFLKLCYVLKSCAPM